jgi:hypothetical protein
VDSALPKGWSPCDIDTETMMLNTNVRRKIEVIPIHQVSEDSCKERTVPLVGWRENVRDLMECKHSHRRSPLVRLLNIDDAVDRVRVSLADRFPRVPPLDYLYSHCLDTQIGDDRIDVSGYVGRRSEVAISPPGCF